jgi:hypothetical protein
VTPLGVALGSGFVDESGVNLSMVRQEAWVPRDDRIVDYVSGRRWETYSLSIALDGLHAPLLVPGAMNTDAPHAVPAPRGHISGTALQGGSPLFRRHKTLNELALGWELHDMWNLESRLAALLLR